ncbi:MAG: translation elongation factor Ts [Gemmatimonadota bacterium]
MTEITVEAIKSLRDRTGAGMMDCKEALEEAGGDEEEAVDLLRKKGASKAAKRAGRATDEGTVRVAGSDDGGPVAMVAVTSETDFVAKNDEFVAFAERAARAARDADGLPEGETRPGEELLDLPEDEPLRDELNGLRAKIGENLQLARWVRWEPADDAVVADYVHFGDKIGVLVELGGVDDREEARALARDVAMHAAATDPAGVSPDDIPEEERERERKVLREQAEEQGKPPDIVEKIVEGRMRKFYEENALLEQPFVRDPDVKVGDRVAKGGDDLEVRRFVRFEVGS